MEGFEIDVRLDIPGLKRFVKKFCNVKDSSQKSKKYFCRNTLKYNLFKSLIYNWNLKIIIIALQIQTKYLETKIEFKYVFFVLNKQSNNIFGYISDCPNILPVLVFTLNKIILFLICIKKNEIFFYNRSLIIF